MSNHEPQALLQAQGQRLSHLKWVADLEEKSDRYIVTVNAPGADESSIDVKLKNQQLHISIKTEQAKDEDSDKNGQYRYRECFVGEFHRILTLPDAGKESDMKTVYKNGVLTINIPKKT